MSEQRNVYVAKIFIGLSNKKLYLQFTNFIIVFIKGTLK